MKNPFKRSTCFDFRFLQTLSFDFSLSMEHIKCGGMISPRALSVGLYTSNIYLSHSKCGQLVNSIYNIGNMHFPCCHHSFRFL